MGEILFIAHRMPFPPNRGDKIRSHHILQRLARIAPVHVACFADDDDDMAEEVELAAGARSYRLVRRAKPLVLAGMEALAKGTPVSLTAFYDAKLAHYVQNLLESGKISTVYVFSGQMGQYVPADWQGQVIMDFVDVDSAKFEAYAAKRGGVIGWVDAREARLLRAEEARLAIRADISLLISRNEADLFTSRLSPADHARCDVRVLGNGIDSAGYDPERCRPEPRLAEMDAPRIVFTGQMDYAPNVAAVQRVALNILPQIRRVLPGATFHIVGRNPTDAVQALIAEPGVHVWGRVPDVRGWLRGADMALVPLDIARGVQNKVLEAMAMELPVVLTSGAANGISAVSGHHFAVADSDQALAEAVLAMAADPAWARGMGLAARRFVVEQQSWQSALAPLAAMVLGQQKVRRDAA